MKSLKNLIEILILAVALLLSHADTEKSVEVTTAKSDSLPTDRSGTNATTSNPLDNGMAIRDVRDHNDVYNKNLTEATKESSAATSTGPVVFPSNPRNYSSLQYAVEESRPPSNHRHKYQDSYPMYRGEKNLKNSKPLKFEENSLKTVFISPKYEKKKQLGDAKGEQSQFIVKPFPYIFESDHLHENWYENVGGETFKAHGAPFDTFHHDDGATYYVYPQEVTHDDYKTDFYQHDNRWNSEVKQGAGSKSPWKKIAQFVTALVPLGLLLASLTPSVFTIDNVNNVQARQRSNYMKRARLTEEDVLKLLQENGVDSETLSNCEDRVICELAKKGSHSPDDSIEKGFWLLAHRTPAPIAEKSGMSQLFESIRTGNCESLKCDAKPNRNLNGKIKRKIIRKRKLADQINQ